MALNFTDVLRKLLENFKTGISIRNTSDELMLLGYYEFPDVCLATIEFWFNTFLKYDHYNHRLFTLNFITRDDLKEFFLELIAKNPSWTTAHFVDAFKVNNKIIYNYMDYLGYTYTSVGWSKPL
ncbi:hypothetical protein M0804_014207 [Polistes exclamans]|nr:hypothetical protein M0804_014207 [Polistes exclamans]